MTDLPNCTCSAKSDEDRLVAKDHDAGCPRGVALVEARERHEQMKRDQEMTARYQTPGSPHGGWERARDWGD